ncbi:MAG TPA: SMP-30/gluconolactonase/LRE family protein [Acidimicrobiia bacterium]|nr:SMP-30/gluconolactonase/LRE family protein [Acidimicrobiia bacterium]
MLDAVIEARPPIVLEGVELVAEGLVFPEGPIVMPDGSVLVTEMRRGTLTRIVDGRAEVVAECGVGANGAAVGPDGAVYVCNNGGYGDEYRGGAIQVVDPGTGSVELLYTECGGHRLAGPNDLVFDDDGAFWFTDTGKFRARDRDRGGIYYATTDGATIREAAYPVDAPNGIGLAPDGSAIYYAETLTGRLYRRAVTGRGELEPAAEHDPSKLLCGLPGLQMFDSLAVDDAGNVCVATLFSSCVTVVAPDGAWMRQLVLAEPFHDPMVTNVCFTPDGATVYITLSDTGRVVRCPWPPLA